MLQPMLQQLAQSNPQLAQALAHNPEALLDILGGGEGDDGEPIPPGAQVLSVTPEERDAIERVGHFRCLSSGTYPDL
jgi:UV excision repair protein RAD23